MKSQWLLYIGSLIIFFWGAAHIYPIKAVVEGFGQISTDNKRIITMEWIAEGFTLCFLGVVIFSITFAGGMSNPVGILTYRLVSGMLLVMAVLTMATGARTSTVPIKICPAVKIVVAVLVLLGSL